jgi:hypothetical protein
VKEIVMAVVARIIGYSLLTAGMGAGIGFLLFVNASDHERIGLIFLSFVLACLGTIVGAIAGAAGEIVAAQRRLAEPKPVSKTQETWD